MINTETITMKYLEHKKINIKKAKGDMRATEEYPWAYHVQEAFVEKVYPEFILLTILPHEHPGGFGLSIPYKTTISKVDIITQNNPKPLGPDVFSIKIIE